MSTNEEHVCPYGGYDCPKVSELKGRIDKIENHLEHMYGLMWGIAGGVMAAVIGIIGVLIT